MANYSIEIERNNVTLAQFLRYVRQHCEKKGIYFEIDRETFEKPLSESDFTRYYYTDEFEETELCRYDWTENGADAPCKAEICSSFAYDYQTYILNFDGSMYNEICEFTFDDEKTGHGYYYQANRDAAE